MTFMPASQFIPDYDDQTDSVGEVWSRIFTDGIEREIDELGNAYDDGRFAGVYLARDGTFELLLYPQKLRYNDNDTDWDNECPQSGITLVSHLFEDGVHRSCDMFGKVYETGVRIGMWYDHHTRGRVFVPRQ